VSKINSWASSTTVTFDAFCGWEPGIYCCQAGVRFFLGVSFTGVSHDLAPRENFIGFTMQSLPQLYNTAAHVYKGGSDLLGLKDRVAAPAFFRIKIVVPLGYTVG